MEPNKNYLMVGAFTLIGIVMLILFSLWLTNSTEKRDYVYYQVLLRESVGGLSNGSPVKYRGVDIGNVVGINIDFDKTDTIITRLRVLKGSPVKQNTVATLKTQGITGTSYIELSGGDADQPRIEGSSANKGPLPEIPAKFSNIATLSNEVPELISKASQIATQANRMIDDEAVANTQEILRRWSSISIMMEKEAAQLDVLMKTTRHLVETTDKVMTQIDGAGIGSTLKDLHDTTAQLKELATHTNQTTETSFEELSLLLLDAKRTSKELRTFTRALSENPSQIIFPTHDKQEQLP